MLMTTTQSALSARLQTERSKPRKNHPGPSVVERMFAALGGDAQDVKDALTDPDPANRLSPEVIERVLKSEGVVVVASASQIRRWVKENS